MPAGGPRTTGAKRKPKMNNLYLVGMMGSGKSVTGKKLAALLGYAFVDLDQWIEEKHRRSITEIFEKEGETFFRAQEAVLLAEACGAGPRVVATGGGTVLRPENVERMQATGKVIYLETSLGLLWHRVKSKQDRPLLKGADPKTSLASIFEARRPLYEKSADFSVNTDGQTAEKVARKILEELRKIS